MELISVSLDLFAIAIIAVLLIGTLLKNVYPKPFGKKIIVLLVAQMVGLLCDSIVWIWSPQLFPNIDISVAIVVQKTVLFVAYCALVTMLIVYTHCIVRYIGEKTFAPKHIEPFVTVVGIVSVIFWVSSLFSELIFTFDHNGMFIATKFYGFSQGVMGLLMCIDIAVILKYRKIIGWKNAAPLLVYLLLPVCGLVLSIWLDVTPMYLAATLSMLLMFIVFHLEQDKQLKEQELMLTQSHISIMLSQIQPHFLYNTLNAICGLCDENPKEAKKVTAEFADYLRHNLESITVSTPVSFEEELQHTKVYLDIEKKRFEQRLNIVYDIATSDFRVPTLTVQPIVENAVKHGITKKKNGGTITIKTREIDGYYVISIVDDGVGFDTDTPHPQDESHIGIDNVRQRLWAISHAALTITSEKNAGTIATIKIARFKT